MWQRARAQAEFHPEMAALAGALLGCLITRSKQQSLLSECDKLIDTHERTSLQLFQRFMIFVAFAKLQSFSVNF